MKPVLTLLLLCSTTLLQAQDIELEKHNIDSIYRRADSIALSVPFTTDIIAATAKLVQPCKSNIEKYRALFRWVAEHIEYDIAMYNKGLYKESGKQIECKDKNDCELKLNDYYFQYCKSILNKKAGICDGYSRLYKIMCSFAKLPCEVVEGYAKNRDTEIGINPGTNHAWNAVLLGKDWYFLDATWAAGYVDYNEETEKLTRFIRGFNNWYFLKDSKTFLLSHYPKDEKWLLDMKWYKKADFYAQPFYYGSWVERYIRPEYHREKGIINIGTYDTLLCFTHKLSPAERKLLKEKNEVTFTMYYKTKTYSDEPPEYAQTIFFEDRIHYCVPLMKQTPSSLVIYINGSPAIRYKIRLQL